MIWLIVIVSAYFIFALTTLIDRYLLLGPPNPKSYSFYVGTLGIFTVLLIPFVGFSVPSLSQLFLALLTGAIYIFALLALFTCLEKYEASRAVPAIGGLLPLFVFGLVYFLPQSKEILTQKELTAFILLILGSVVITFRKSKSITFNSFIFSAITAILFAIAFVLTKFVYLAQPFWSGFIWMRIGGFIVAITFIFTKEVKEETIQKKFTFQKKTGIIFLMNQLMGAGGLILQNWAIALAGIFYLPFINALQGIQYLFLLIFSFLFSSKFPYILKEEISREILFQKIIAILLIGAGLALLAL